MDLKLRKVVRYQEAILMEGGRASPHGCGLYAAAAVLENPWVGRGFVEDLKPEIHRMASPLGQLLTAEILAMVGGGEAVEGYGKAAVVGISCEIEHGSALIHTLRFGNHYRKAVGAKSYLSFSNTRGGPNCPIVIPMMHKMDEGMRSHYLTVQFSVLDAPGPDEIVRAPPKWLARSRIPMRPSLALSGSRTVWGSNPWPSSRIVQLTACWVIRSSTATERA